MHLEMSLSATIIITIIILLRIFSMALNTVSELADLVYQHNNLKSAVEFSELIDGEFRMIHHLTYQEGSSVNDFIPKEISGIQYATIQDAIRFIKQQPDNQVFMAKVDIESAFIPVSPLDRPLLGFQWKGKFFMDVVLPMGISSACVIFESFGTALEWVAKSKQGATAVVHVIDEMQTRSTSFC